MSEMIERGQAALIAKFGRTGAWDVEMLAVMTQTVIEAMREPTGEQRAAVRAIPTGNWEIARDYWRTMIDAALKE